MILRRLLIAGFLLDVFAAAATAKLVTVGPDVCPVSADVEAYAPPPGIVAPSVTPRLKVEKSVVLLKDVRLDSSPGDRLFARIAIDPETGGFFGAEPLKAECNLLD